MPPTYVDLIRARITRFLNDKHAGRANDQGRFIEYKIGEDTYYITVSRENPDGDRT